MIDAFTDAREETARSVQSKARIWGGRRSRRSEGRSNSSRREERGYSTWPNWGRNSNSGGEKELQCRDERCQDGRRTAQKILDRGGLERKVFEAGVVPFERRSNSNRDNHAAICFRLASRRQHLLPHAGTRSPTHLATTSSRLAESRFRRALTFFGAA